MVVRGKSQTYTGVYNAIFKEEKVILSYLVYLDISFSYSLNKNQIGICIFGNKSNFSKKNKCTHKRGEHTLCYFILVYPDTWNWVSTRLWCCFKRDSIGSDIIYLALCSLFFMSETSGRLCVWLALSNLLPMLDSSSMEHPLACSVECLPWGFVLQCLWLAHPFHRAPRR